MWQCQSVCATSIVCLATYPLLRYSKPKLQATISLGSLPPCRHPSWLLFLACPGSMSRATAAWSPREVDLVWEWEISPHKNGHFNGEYDIVMMIHLEICVFFQKITSKLGVEWSAHHYRSRLGDQSVSILAQKPDAMSLQHRYHGDSPCLLEVPLIRQWIFSPCKVRESGWWKNWSLSTRRFFAVAGHFWTRAFPLGNSWRRCSIMLV